MQSITSMSKIGTTKWGLILIASSVKNSRDAINNSRRGCFGEVLAALGLG